MQSHWTAASMTVHHPFDPVTPSTGGNSYFGPKVYRLDLFGGYLEPFAKRLRAGLLRGIITASPAPRRLLRLPTQATHT